jgi:ATP-binding cassette subfamily B (MDR/TAP) protein 1
MRRSTTLEVDVEAARITNDLAYDSRSSLYTSNLSSIDLKASPTESQQSIAAEPTPSSGPAPSISLLFSLISRRQCYILLLPAVLTSIVAGGIAPFMTYVIGQAFDAFAKFPLTPNPPQSAKDTLLRAVGIAALELLALGVGSMLLSSLTSSLWIWTGERNTMALRKLVYNAVTKKDMVWFDTKMGAEGNVQSAEGEQGPLGAGGLMAKFTR